jgi:mono/diheme cytochrome c family protein
MKFFAGFLVGLLLVVLIFAVVVASGTINMAASSPPGIIEENVGNALFRSSLQKRAPNETNPYLHDKEAIEKGEHEYKEMCVDCHGVDGVEPGPIGKGLNPPAPYLDARVVQKKTDGQLFWIIDHGIRMTGMPAFGKTHPDDEIQKIVAYVRTLPDLTPAQKEELRTGEHEKDEQEEQEH